MNNSDYFLNGKNELKESFSRAVLRHEHHKKSQKVKLGINGVLILLFLILGWGFFSLYNPDSNLFSFDVHNGDFITGNVILGKEVLGKEALEKEVVSKRALDGINLEGGSEKASTNPTEGNGLASQNPILNFENLRKFYNIFFVSIMCVYFVGCVFFYNHHKKKESKSTRGKGQ